MRTFASRYRLEHQSDGWRILDVVRDETTPPTFTHRGEAEWALAAERDLEMRAAGLTDLDILDTTSRVMNKYEIKKARANVT